MSVNLLIQRTCSLCQKFSASSNSPVNARSSATQKIKRFYRNVNIQQCTGQQNVNTQMVDQLELGCNRDTNVTKFSLSFNVLLDERVLKTPSGTKVTLNSEALALSVANEWMAQHEYILPATMHFTSLVNTCTDNPLLVFNKIYYSCASVISHAFFDQLTTLICAYILLLPRFCSSALAFLQNMDHVLSLSCRNLFSWPIFKRARFF